MPIKFKGKELYSVKELAEILPITGYAIREYFRRGKLKGKKIGKNWYISKKNLEQFLDSNE